MRHITIAKHHLAAGLQWFMGKSKQTIADLRHDAAKQDTEFDMVAYRQRQYGFAASGGSIKKWLGVRALAASIRITSPSFLGLFCLADQEGEFWWVFAMSQGLIIGMGDQIFSQRSDAVDWIQSLQGLLDSEFAETITCETVDESLHWLTPLISTGPFSRLRSRNGYLRPLQPIPGQQRSIFVIGSIAVIVALSGYGIHLFLKQQAGKRAIERARIAMLNKEQHKKELLLHPEKYFAKPWLTAPNPEEFFVFGVKSLLQVPLVSAGWTLETAAFSGQSVKITWVHKPGADYVHLPLHSRLQKPNEATSYIHTPYIISRSHKKQSDFLLSRDECSRLFYQGTQIFGARLRLVFTAPEEKKVDNIKINCPWMKGQWELTNIPDAVIQDRLLPAPFTKVPGFIPKIIAYKKNMWVFKGDVYVTAK